MKYAEDLRIGDTISLTGMDGERITALHELCVSRPTPHVHVVTNHTSRCFGFRTWLGRHKEEATA